MDANLPTLNPGELVKGRYAVDKKLGEGGFGAVYKVKDNTNGELYAMKIESCKEQIQVLKMEVVVLNELAKRGGRHICAIQDRGRNDQYNYVIMSLVGQSLADLKKACPGGKFSIGSALRLGVQCLEALEDLHRIGYLHRDVKPGNFAVGREDKQLHRTVVILDFGLARKYINDRGEIRTPRAAAGFRGTVRYAPIGCHKSRELSRKDDLEVWFYQQVEITAGRLPWASIADKDEVGRSKESTRQSGELFANCPQAYRQCLVYIDQIKYWDQPDYEMIYGVFRQICQQNNIRDQDPYDWEKGGGGHQFTSRLPDAGYNPHGGAPIVNF